MDFSDGTVIDLSVHTATIVNGTQTLFGILLFVTSCVSLFSVTTFSLSFSFFTSTDPCPSQRRFKAPPKTSLIKFTEGASKRMKSRYERMIVSAKMPKVKSVYKEKNIIRK